MLNKIVGKNISYYRLQKGISQKKAASLAGITPSYWGYLERGQKNPSINLIEKISGVLNIEAHLLFINSPEKNLPVEIMHCLHVVNSMEPKYIEFVSTFLREYVNLHKPI